MTGCYRARAGVAGLCLGLAVVVPAGVCAEPRRLAVLPAIGEGVPAAVLDAVDVTLESMALLVPGVETVADESLREALGRDPQAALKECGDDLGCIFGLGHRANAVEVLLPRVAGIASGYELSWSVLSVSDRSVLRGETVRFSVADEVEAALTDREISIFKGEQANGSGVEDQEPCGTEDVWQGSAIDPSLPIEPLPVVSPPPPSTAKKNTAFVDRPLFTRMTAGIGAGVVAGVATAVGSYFAVRYYQAKSAIDAHGPKTTSLKEALRLEARANDARPFAISGFVVGGVAAASALGLILWDLKGPGAARATVAASPHGGAVVIRF